MRASSVTSEAPRARAVATSIRYRAIVSALGLPLDVDGSNNIADDLYRSGQIAEQIALFLVGGNELRQRAAAS